EELLLGANRADGLGEVMGDVLVTEDALGEAASEGQTQRDIAVDLEEVVELIDVAVPDLGPSVDELSDVREGLLAEAEKMLAFCVALGPLAVDRGDARRPVLGQGRALVATKLPLVLGDEAAGDDLDA